MNRWRVKQIISSEGTHISPSLGRKEMTSGILPGNAHSFILHCVVGFICHIILFFLRVFFVAMFTSDKRRLSYVGPDTSGCFPRHDVGPHHGTTVCEKKENGKKERQSGYRTTPASLLTEEYAYSDKTLRANEGSNIACLFTCRSIHSLTHSLTHPFICCFVALFLLPFMLLSSCLVSRVLCLVFV